MGYGEGIAGATMKAIFKMYHFSAQGLVYFLRIVGYDLFLHI